jgi:hypothetical protein
MQSGSGRLSVLVLLLAAGVLLALGVYQVPQPWRGVLVAWLFVCGTLGWLVMRLVKHHYEFKALQQRPGSRRTRRAAPAASPAPPRFEGLKVVRSNEAGGRYTIR